MVCGFLHAVTEWWPRATLLQQITWKFHRPDAKSQTKLLEAWVGGWLMLVTPEML
jgi:hypothetical protein